MSFASFLLGAVILAAALISCVPGAHAALPPSQARTEERLLLDRDFEALEVALRNRAPSDLTAERLFVLASTKLDADAFLRLYDIAPEETKREAMTAAAKQGRTDLLEGLVKRGLDPAAARGLSGSIVTTAARAGKINVIEWALKSGVKPLPENAPINELGAAAGELAAARKPDQQLYAASAFRWLESRGFRPPVDPGAVFELVNNLLRYGDTALLDRYVRMLKAKSAFDPNAKFNGTPLVYSANSVATLKFLEAEGATLDVPSVNEALERARAVMAQVSGFFPNRPGAARMDRGLDMFGPTHRANPLENFELDREARAYLVSKGLRPQGDALYYAILDVPTDFAIVEAMLKAGADLKATRPNGSTILHALVSGPLRTKAPCRPSPRETQPSCPTETVKERAQLMAQLVARGADPAQPDKNGTSALDAARKLADEQRRQAYVSALSPKP